MSEAIRDLARAGALPLPQLVRLWALAQPDALAFREKDFGIWKRISWGDYARTMDHLALGLAALGYQAGDRLAIAGEGVPEWMYADMAAQSLGGICVGLYPTSPWRELAYILGHSGARIVVCGDQEQVDKILEARRQAKLPNLAWIIYVDGKGMRNYSDEGLIGFADVVAHGRRLAEQDPGLLAAHAEQMAARSPDDPAIIVYTSGTTGAPKGAMLSHRNLLVAGCSVVDTFGYDGRNHEVLCYLPLCHVAERSFSTVMQLCCGSVVNFAESVDTVSSDLREIGPTLFLGVPRIWEKLQQTITIKIKESYSLHRWAYQAALALAMPIARREIAAGGRRVGLCDRLVAWLLHVVMFRNIQRFAGLYRADACFCGAASVSPETLLFFRAIGLPIYQVYGMTETAAVALLQQPGHTGFGCVGVPIPSLRYRLGEDGELQMKGPTVFLGYLDAPEATAAVLDDGWLASGDIARIVDEEVQIIDRKKDLIITSGGKNISPSEIENALKESVYIREAIVVGDGRNFVAALLQIDYDTVGKWAQERQLSFTTYRSLASLGEVRELVGKDVQQANERFARVAQVRKFSLLTKELDHDDGELTATMKVRRKSIEQKFAGEIAELYGARA
ncbi:MAG: AMP-binding protein [Pseudomonadota bacterium]